MRCFKTLIIGATALGIGKACALNDPDTLLTDSGIICAHEFTACYKAGRINTETALSAPSEKLLSKMRECNLVEDGNISIPSVSGILAEMLLNSGTRVMFMTEVTHIEKTENGFNVTLFSSDGFETVFTEKILDTIAMGTLHSLGENLPYTTEYTAAVTKTENIRVNSEGEYCGATLKRCRFEGEYIFSIPVSGDDIVEARKKLHGIWQKCVEKYLPEFELDMTAHEFRYSLPPEYGGGYTAEVEQGFVFSPSCAYNDVLSAFEGGAAL